MINILKWDNSLSTGFNEVDLQHKKLILIIQDVYESMQSPPEEYTLRMAKDLKKLTDYTEYHFSEEQAFMQKYDYPGYDKHKAEHDNFINTIQAQVKTLSQSSSDDGFLFYRFLGSWLLAHIARADQEWAAFIREARSKNGE